MRYQQVFGIDGKNQNGNEQCLLKKEEKKVTKKVFYDFKSTIIFF